MEMEEETNSGVNKLAQVDYYVKLALKRRWFIIIPFCLSMIGGIIFGLTTPEVYSAKNLIVVVPKTVPDEYVMALQTTDIPERIKTIKQQILSRSNLERIIDQFELFSDPKYKNMYEEDKIALIRRSVSVDVTKSRGGISSFKILFRGGNPIKVRDVVNSLADSFINESVKIIQEEALETNYFLQGELLEIRNKLEEIEKNIEKYRQKYMGKLPEELSSNLKLIERFQMQLNEKQQSIRETKNRIADLDNLIAASKLNAAAVERSSELAADLSAASNPVVKLQPVVNPTLSELKKSRQILEQLKTRYTERHPDIIRLKFQIEILEKKYEAEKENTSKMLAEKENDTPEDEDSDLPEKAKNSSGPVFDQALMTLMIQRKSSEREINEYKQDIVKLEKLIDKYQTQIEGTPKVELGLMSLQRNYDNIQRNYKNLLDRKLESDIAVNLEKKQKGQKFRIIDKAKLPHKPVAPDMKKVFMACIVLGVGLGGGVIFLLDFVDSSLKRPEKIESDMGVPVMATIPQIYTSRQIFIHKLNHLMTLAFIIVGFNLFLILGLITVKGTARTITYFKALVEITIMKIL